MASSSEHKAKASQNYAFLQTLLGVPDQNDWKATVAFYVAVHLVERLFANVNVHSQNHSERFGNFTRFKQFRGVYTDYKILYDASIIARYQTSNAFTKAYPKDTVEKILIQKHLKNIIDFVDQFFAPKPPAASS